jgi:hypothetical protein
VLLDVQVRDGDVLLEALEALDALDVDLDDGDVERSSFRPRDRDQSRRQDEGRTGQDEQERPAHSPPPPLEREEQEARHAHHEERDPPDARHRRER